MAAKLREGAWYFVRLMAAVAPVMLAAAGSVLAGAVWIADLQTAAEARQVLIW
ncbi:hypothetical protein [Geobacter benzoatilyticus]|uniref:Uncharacterized protein n=1 Tax=Geobacter benzoatilyticus TaxID=2815309 RepID=A0ABX7Q7P5_9BACT|nr:hypothetical protein [Geobacter benzoatilyticus]QSV47078.1 hypothetical protein JZM60_07410 [Geobacter benzoatilyticus]